MNSLFDKHATTHSLSDFLLQMKHKQMGSVVEKNTLPSTGCKS